MAHGGKRTNAGRKSGSINKLTAVKRAAPRIKKVLAEVKQEIKSEIKGDSANRAVSAAMVLSAIEELPKWKKLLESKDESVQLKALCYLTDQRDGKAKQRVEMKADVNLMDKRTDEELKFYALHGYWPEA